MTEQKKFLNSADFETGKEPQQRLLLYQNSMELANYSKGLLALDNAMGQDPWLVAFAPIRLISAGGFLAVSYLGITKRIMILRSIQHTYLLISNFAGRRNIPSVGCNL